MHGIIPLHRSNVIGINASRGDWLNELRMRLRTIWGSSCNYIMGEHYRWGWRGTWKRDFPPQRTHMAMTGRRLELRPGWKRLASKEMDSEAMVFMTLLPYKGGRVGGWICVANWELDYKSWGAVGFLSNWRSTLLKLYLTHALRRHPLTRGFPLVRKINDIQG